MPKSYSLEPAFRVIELLQSDRVRKALEEAQNYIVSMGYTLSQDPAWGELELEAGKLSPAISETVFYAFETNGADAMDVLSKQVVGKLDRPTIITIHDLWEEFIAQMRVRATDFDVAYELFVGNVQKRVLRARSSRSFAIGELATFQVFRVPAEADEARPRDAEGAVPVDAEGDSTVLPLTLWERNGVKLVLTGKGIADLDPENPIQAGPWDERHLAYARVAGVMSERACSLLHDDLARLSRSVVRTISTLEPRYVSNEPTTRLPWVTGGLLQKNRPVIAECLNINFAAPATGDSIDRRLRNAIRLLVSADEQGDSAVALALAFSAVEAMLCEGTDGISDQLAWKCTTLLTPEGEVRLGAEPAIKKLYGVRSKAMHGDKIEVTDAAQAAVRKLAAGVLRSVIERRSFVKRLALDPEKPKDLFDALKLAHRTSRAVDGVPSMSVAWLPKAADCA